MVRRGGRETIAHVLTALRIDSTVQRRESNFFQDALVVISWLTIR